MADSFVPHPARLRAVILGREIRNLARGPSWVVASLPLHDRWTAAEIPIHWHMLRCVDNFPGEAPLLVRAARNLQYAFPSIVYHSPARKELRIPNMSLAYFAVSIQAERMFANEVESDEVAVLLEAGHSVLLARPVDLVRVAVRHKKALTVFSRDEVLRSHHQANRPTGAPLAGDGRVAGEAAGANSSARKPLAQMHITQSRI